MQYNKTGKIYNWKLLGFVAFLLILNVYPLAQANNSDDRVVVLTSYAEEVSTRFQAAFERAYPGKRVEILWRHGEDAYYHFIQTGGAGIDVYWTPAPGNFAMLRRDNRLARLDLERKALPRDIGGVLISDPDDYYAAFELAGYGIAYNPDAVKALGLLPPQDWADLAAIPYANKVQMPIPGSVGFAPVLYEAILQGYGWEKGWAILSEIAGNAVFNRTSLPDGKDPVATGEIAARMTMDFFVSVASGTNGSGKISFSYPPRTVYNPAHIAIFAKAPHPETAREFVNFTLSEEGQKLLLHPDIHRLPVRPALYRALPDLAVNPFTRDSFGYNASVGRERRGLVSALFDITLVRFHHRQVALWKTLHMAENAGLGAEPDVQRARELLTTPLLSDSEQKDSVLRQTFAFTEKAEKSTSATRTQIENQWITDLTARMAEARQLLEPYKNR
ncbi:ABC transporter substrate-binding protein [Mixta theicola]|uniref:ABC transporter substrate-binding protein n=1 Tax=Mixta theicola TaxID=1458355 RepID=A0A2K1Q5F7_9GAMM|nr:ABC transporter substrate-binding protein [Mixta theicola]PNS10272.1 ABC transporter substrate-binding protein [Mixta theicola]GLR09540.1 regulatory lipoprotein [Mixta theicola]